MGLEAATFVSDLVDTNPVTGDNVSQGDDHLRLLKTVLKTTFPNANRAIYFPEMVSKTGNFSVLSTERETTFLVDTTSGVLTGTLPTLAASDDGWQCHFIKTNTGTNPLLIAPPSGTIQSGAITGLAKTRRCVPGVRSTAIWTGTAWVVTRAIDVPVGSTINFCGSSLPVGYEWPNGQTLASASTNYPDFFSANGSSGVTLDKRGRVTAGKDDMGGASADRLTNQSGGLNGDTLGATGGVETHTLTTAQLATHTHTASQPSHTHEILRSGVEKFFDFISSGGGGSERRLRWNDTVGSSDLSISSKTPAITVDNAGSGSAHNNVQPTIIQNVILVVE